MQSPAEPSDLPPRGGGYPIRASTEVSLAAARDQGLDALTPTLTHGLSIVYRGQVQDDLFTYLARDPIVDGYGELDLLAAGGVIISEHHNWVPLMRLTIVDGEPVWVPVEDPTTWTPVLIGPHNGEISQGGGLYMVRWREGATLWVVQAAWDDPAKLIDVARSMVCG
jgi:hypothetical protein